VLFLRVEVAATVKNERFFDERVLRSRSVINYKVFSFSFGLELADCFEKCTLATVLNNYALNRRMKGNQNGRPRHCPQTAVSTASFEREVVGQ